MRGARWAVIVLALLPSFANAAPEGSSADKRMLLFRTAIGRDNCSQARDVTESMKADFPDDSGVNHMLAQVLACEGKWPEAFVPMMAAKAVGVDVAEVEGKILAQVALVDVTVTVDGKESDVPLPVVARTAAASWAGVSLGAGRFVFAVPDGEVGFALTSEQLPYDGKVAARSYPSGQRHAVSLALASVRTVSLKLPEGLSPAVTVTANGVELEDAAREVRIDGDVGREVHFVATWKTPQDTLLTVQWDGDASTPVAPWAHIVRNRDGRIADMGLHRPEETSVVVEVSGDQGETDRVEIKVGDKWLQEVSLQGKKSRPVVQVGLEGEWLGDDFTYSAVRREEVAVVDPWDGEEYYTDDYTFYDTTPLLTTSNGAAYPAVRLYAHKRLNKSRLDLGGYLRTRGLYSVGSSEPDDYVVHYQAEGVVFARRGYSGLTAVEGGLSYVVTGVAHANLHFDVSPKVFLGPYAGVRKSWVGKSITPSVDTRLILPLIFDSDAHSSLTGGSYGGLEVEGSLKFKDSPVSIRVATRSVSVLFLETPSNEYVRLGLDWSL